MLQRISRVLLICVLSAHRIFGQEDTPAITSPYTFSIEEDVLNLKVQSAESREAYAASRDNESLQETAISTYIVTAEEIKHSGAINMGEVLRLVPGVLVKQKTNGYYDVSIRGVSGVIDHQEASNLENTSILLTINGIPLNNWFQGGILWEAIPVELNDIQQIEVVTVPNTVFFGPNAATGVINIVTKNVEEKKLQAKVGLQGNVNGDYVHRGAANFGVSDQLKFRVSGHYNRLTRFQDEFYLLNKQRYILSDSLLYYQATARETNVSSEKSLRNTGINAFAMYQPNSEVSIEAMVGTKESYLQSVLRPLDRIALTNRDLKSSMATVHTRFRNFHTNIAYQSGAHNLAVGYEGFDMHTENLYASTEYDYTGNFYQAKIGGDINYNIFRNNLAEEFEEIVDNITYADRILLGTTRLYNTGFFMNQNLRLSDRKWRLLAALRGDRFSITNQFYWSYQLGSTYKIGKRHLIRANTSYGLGNFSAQNYLSYSNTTSRYEANQLLKPLKVHAYEMGYKVVPYSDLSIGITYFRNKSFDFIDSTTTMAIEKVNSNIITLQHGITMNVQWSLSKLKTTAFLTLQDSRNILEAEKSLNASVPNYFGGLTGSYRTFLNKIRVNASLYFYDGSTLTGSAQNYVLPSKLVTNCKISYNVWNEHVVFFNGRNVLNNQKIESPFADQIKNLYMIGIDLAF